MPDWIGNDLFAFSMWEIQSHLKPSKLWICTIHHTNKTGFCLTESWFKYVFKILWIGVVSYFDNFTNAYRLSSIFVLAFMDLEFHWISVPTTIGSFLCLLPSYTKPTTYLLIEFIFRYLSQDNFTHCNIINIMPKFWLKGNPCRLCKGCSRSSYWEGIIQLSPMTQSYYIAFLCLKQQI